jgi:lysophospholipase L1-like esterase
MPRHETFSIEIPVNDPKAMDAFQKAMNEYYDDLTRTIEKEAEELGIPIGAMSDVWYLRSRSRWTQEKEDYLIRLARKGKQLPNMMEDFQPE